MFESSSKIAEMDMNNLRIVAIQFAILSLSIRADGLSAKSKPSEIYQTTDTEEDEDSIDIVLQNKEAVVHCVGIDLHSDYCLALKPSGILSESRSYTVSLDEKLVRNCSSSDICTDHGALVKHTRPQEAADGCEGIPFANIHKNLTGKYTFIIDNPRKRLNASFNLAFCKGGKSDDGESLEISLKFKGKATDCVSHSDHDSFCLQLKLAGQPVKNKAFQCSLRDELIFSYFANGSYTAHGILQGNVRPSYAVKDCSGIPFSNVVPAAAGQYSCKVEVEDETRPIKEEFDLHFCNGSPIISNETEAQAEENLEKGSPIISNETEAQAEENLEKDSTSNSHSTTTIGIVLTIIILVTFLACGVCFYKRRAAENSTSILPQDQIHESGEPLHPANTAEGRAPENSTSDPLQDQIHEISVPLYPANTVD